MSVCEYPILTNLKIIILLLQLIIIRLLFFYQLIEMLFVKCKSKTLFSLIISNMFYVIGLKWLNVVWCQENACYLYHKYLLSI